MPFGISSGRDAHRVSISRSSICTCPEKKASSAAPISAGSTSVRKPTRPTLMPSTGTPSSAATRAPRRNVPSPPTVTMSAGWPAASASSPALRRRQCSQSRSQTSISLTATSCVSAQRRTMPAASTAVSRPVCTTRPIRSRAMISRLSSVAADPALACDGRWPGDPQPIRCSLRTVPRSPRGGETTINRRPGSTAESATSAAGWPRGVRHWPRPRRPAPPPAAPPTGRGWPPSRGWPGTAKKVTRSGSAISTASPISRPGAATTLPTPASLRRFATAARLTARARIAAASTVRSDSGRVLPMPCSAPLTVTVSTAAHQTPSTGNAMPTRARCRTPRLVGSTAVLRAAGSSRRNAAPSAPAVAASRSSMVRSSARHTTVIAAGTATIASPNPPASEQRRPPHRVRGGPEQGNQGADPQAVHTDRSFSGTCGGIGTPKISPTRSVVVSAALNSAQDRSTSAPTSSAGRCSNSQGHGHLPIRHGHTGRGSSVR